MPRPRRPAGWTVTDGEATVALPDRRVAGRLNLSGNRLAGVERDAPLGALRLANDGDRVALRAPDGRVVDAVGWGDEGPHEVDEGERLVRVAADGDGGPAAAAATASGWRTVPVGGTDLGVARFAGVAGASYVAPDGTRRALERTLANASRRVHVAAYSLDPGWLVDRLVALNRSGVAVRVLVEGRPAGGVERDDLRALRRLARAGAAVDVAVGDRRRYRFLHAKYLVADDAAVVTTQNWGGAPVSDDPGSPPRGSRGWGVVLRDSRVAEWLRGLHRSDRDWRAVEPLVEAAPRLDPVEPRDSDGRLDAVDAPVRRFDGADVRIFVAPDRPVAPIARFVRNASDEVLIQQAYVRPWEDRPNPYVEAAFAAARRGADVRVLLDGRWFVAEENRAAAERLNQRAEREGVPLEVRLADVPVHTKGVVVDREAVLVSSVNWNEHSPTENREIGAIVRSEAAAGHLAATFVADWRGAGGGLPLGRHAAAALVVGLLALAAAAVAWRGFR